MHSAKTGMQAEQTDMQPARWLLQNPGAMPGWAKQFCVSLWHMPSQDLTWLLARISTFR